LGMARVSGQVRARGWQEFRDKYARVRARVMGYYLPVEGRRASERHEVSLCVAANGVRPRRGEGPAQSDLWELGDLGRNCMGPD
jgi:hypothetical protein